MVLRITGATEQVLQVRGACYLGRTKIRMLVPTRNTDQYGVFAVDLLIWARLRHLVAWLKTEKKKCKYHSFL